MATNIKIFNDTSKNADQLERTCNAFIADVEAAGGSIIQTAFSSTQWDERFLQLCVMLTYVEGITESGMVLESTKSEIVEATRPLPKAFEGLDL